MAYSFFLVRYLCVEFACRTGEILTGIFLVKVKAAISDFFSSGRLWKEGNIYQGVANNQKEGEGRGWDNRNFLLSFHSTSTNQTSFAELVTIPCLSKKPLLQASVWDFLFKKQIFQSKEVSMEKRVSCGMLVNWRPNSQSWNAKKYKTVSADKTYWNLR